MAKQPLISSEIILKQLKTTLKEQSRLSPAFLTRAGIPFLGEGSNLDFYLNIDKNIAKRLKDKEFTEEQSNLFLRSAWSAGEKFADWTETQKASGFNQAVVVSQMYNRFQNLIQNIGSSTAESRMKLRRITDDLERINQIERGLTTKTLQSSLLKSLSQEDFLQKNKDLKEGATEWNKGWTNLFKKYNIPSSKQNIVQEENKK